MPFAFLTDADEGRIHADGDRRRSGRRLVHRPIFKLSAEFQGMVAQCPMTYSSIDGKHLFEHVRGDAIGHESRKMGLELIQLRSRPAIQWPAEPGLYGVTCYAPKPGKTHHHPAKKRNYSMVPIVLQMARSAASPKIRPSEAMAPALRGGDHLLNTRLQLLPFSQGQTQIGNIAEIIWPDDLHDIGVSRFTLGISFDQPQNPPHPSFPSRRLADDGHFYLIPPGSGQSRP